MKNKLQINITIKNETEIFEQYNENQLSENFNNYIYNQCKGSKINTNMEINIYSKKLTEIEKKKIINAIRSSFGLDIKENTIKLKYELITEFVLILLGTFLLTISRLFNELNSTLIGEIISIFGCVMIWEVAYNIIFTDTKARIKNKRLKKLTKAKIQFIDI